MNKIIKQIPNMITSMNLISGLYAIYYAFEQDFQKALLFIVIAMLFDAMDGRAARMLKVDGDFGKEYDSLADVITFGVAPMMILVNIYNIEPKNLLFILMLAFPVAGAWRLARFNTETYKAKKHFVGVPITLAGFLMALTTVQSDGDYLMMNVLVMLILSYLMVSNIKVPNFKHIKLSKRLYLYVCVVIMIVYIVYIATQKNEYTLLIIPIILLIAYPLNKIKKKRKIKRDEEKNDREDKNIRSEKD